MNILNPPQIDLLLGPIIKGGSPETTLKKISNITNIYLTEKSTNHNKLVFKFSDEHNKKKIYNSNYLGKGANTSVFAIKQIKPIEDDKLYVIRIFEDTISSVKQLIEKNYIRDKNNFIKAIPNMYCYGEILNIDGKQIHSEYNNLCYVITELYNTNFDSLNFSHKIKIFINLLELLDDAYNKKYFFWDLKFENIGYDDDYNCIMIDYDDRCVIQFPVDNPFYYGGTYVAVYITCLMALGNQHGKNTQQIEYEYDKELLPEKYHDKLGICGLPDIIFNFFFVGNNFFWSLKQRENDGLILHSAYNFYDYHQLQQNIKKFEKIYKKDKYNEFYNNIYNLLIDDNANGILSLYYDKVPSYKKMIDIIILWINY